MAYVFDPINNTLIDDEDKSLGNKLALNDEEFQKLLDIPGVFRASEAPQPPQRPDVIDIEAINRFVRENPRDDKAEGGRIKLKRGSNVIDSLSFEQIRKLFPTYFDAAATATKVDENVIKEILQMYANKEGGRTYIGKQLGLDQSVVGRILKKAEANKLITKVDPKDFKTKESQRIYENPKARKIHNVVRPITELDRKQNPDIPKNARFKVVFATPQGKTTKIPDEFIGVKYFNTEKAANVALDKRLKADFSKPEDPTAAKFKAQKKRTDFLRRNAPLYASGTGNYEFHHIMNIGGEIPLDTSDIAVISKKMNRVLSPYNKDLNRIGDSITTLINEQPKGYLKRIDELNDVGEKIVKKAVKELPKEYRNLIGFNRVVPITDEYGTPINFVGKKFGGSNQKQPGIKLEKLTTEQATNLKNQIKADAKALGKSTVKDKILSSTGKVLKTAGKVIKPIGYAVGTKALFDAQALADEQGIELSLLDQAIALDSGDPELAIKNYKMRTDPEFAMQEKAKTLAIPLDEGTYDVIDEVKPDETIQDFMAHGGRAGFSNGGAAGADVDFATELEYFFTNPDAELPAMKTYKETNNPIEVLNDIINPRNYPYYADVLARSGIRIAEFGGRLLPATGKLISDLIQKPAFKIKSTEDNYVRDYLDPPAPSNIKGTGIFSEFLENITPTTLEKKVGLDTLIKKEEQRLKDTGSTVGPKVFADTIGLGTEVAAPIFPGLKLLKAYAKKNNLPVNDVTKKLLVKEIDEVLEKQGMDRREFLQVTGAGATVILAKMLGFGDEMARTAKVAEKVAEKATGGGVPPYFFQLVEKIKRNGKRLEPEFDARVENNMQFENFVMKENMATGEISIGKTTEGGFNTGDDVIEGTISDELITYKPGENVLGKDGKYYKTADEYEESTAKPDEDGKMKDIEPGLESIEEIIELLPNKLKMSELEDAGYNVDAFPDNIKRLLIDDLQKTN